jgi:aminopeptidase N
VHELAHQWYGDSVAVRRWSEVWLNEGFATYAQWLWSGHEGFGTPADIFNFWMTEVPADDDLWRLEIGDPGPRHLFDFPVYVRGALTLQALRMKIGDQAFFTVLRRWAAQNAGGNGDTRGFRMLAERVSGKQLGALFHTWLHTTTKPSLGPAAARDAKNAAPRGVPMAVKWLQTTRMPR